MARWFVAVFAVLGAFLAGGVLGAVVSDELRVWETPLAGFIAAFAVVTIAYVAAPTRKTAFSFACFVVGAVGAWGMLRNETYPERYQDLAYQPTLVPFGVTCLGGVVGVAVVVLVAARGRARAKRG